MSGQYSPEEFFTKIGYRTALLDEDVEFELEAGGIPFGLPPCPNCGRLLLRTLSISPAVIRDIMIKTWGNRDKWNNEVDLLVCRNCRAAEELIYQGNISSGVKFIKWSKGKEGYPLWDDYPEYFDQVLIKFRQENRKERLLHLVYHDLPYGKFMETVESTDVPLGLVDSPRYQVGGVPYLHELPEPQYCQCGNRMICLATVPNWNGSSTGYFDYDYAMILYEVCFDCFIIRVTHQVD